MSEVNPNPPVEQAEVAKQLEPFYRQLLPEVFEALDKLSPEAREEKVDKLNAIALDAYLTARKAHGMPEAEEAQALQSFIDNLFSPEWLSSLQDLNQPVGDFPGFEATLKRIFAPQAPTVEQPKVA